MATDAAKRPPTDRERATGRVLEALRNRLLLMSRPDREAAFADAREHQITAEDLLRYAHDWAVNS